MQEKFSSERWSLATDEADEYARERKAVDAEIDAATEDVDEVLGRLTEEERDQNPRFRESTEKIAHDERAAEVLELLDAFENDASTIVEYMRQFLALGKEFPKRYPRRMEAIKIILIALRKIKQVQKEEQENSGT